MDNDMKNLPVITGNRKPQLNELGIRVLDKHLSVIEHEALMDKMLRSHTTDILDLLFHYYPFDKEQLLKYKEIFFVMSFDEYFHKLDIFEREALDVDIISANYKKMNDRKLIISSWGNIVWDEDMITTFSEELDFRELSRNPSLMLTEQLLEKFQNKWSYSHLIGNQSIDWTDAMIEKAWACYSQKDEFHCKKNSFLFLFALIKKIPFKEIYLESYLSESSWRQGPHFMGPDDMYINIDNDKYLMQTSLPFSIELLEKYEDLWYYDHWRIIACNTEISWTYDLIETYEAKWSKGDHCFDNGWKSLAQNESLPWSIELVEKIINKNGFHSMAYNKSIVWSLDLLKAIEDKLDPVDWEGNCLNGWEYLSASDAIPWSIELLAAFKDKWSKSHQLHFNCNETFQWRELIDFFINENICVYGNECQDGNWKSQVISEYVIDSYNLERYKHFIDYSYLSSNRNLGSTWSLDFIEEHEEEWDWEYLSRNETLCWSQDLLEKFKDKWSGLYSNSAITWNEQLFIRYFDNIGNPYSRCYKDANKSLIEVIKSLDKDFVDNILDKSCHFHFSDNYELELRWAYFFELIDIEYEFHPPLVELANGEVVAPSLLIYNVDCYFESKDVYVLIARDNKLNYPDDIKQMYAFPIFDEAMSDIDIDRLLFDGNYPFPDYFLTHEYYHDSETRYPSKVFDRGIENVGIKMDVEPFRGARLTFAGNAYRKAALIDSAKIQEFADKKGFQPYPRQRRKRSLDDYLVYMKESMA